MLSVWDTSNKIVYSFTELTIFGHPTWYTYKISFHVNAVFIIKNNILQ